MVRVWDLWVRIGHWCLVLGIAAAWLTRHGSDARHEWIGYGVLALIAIRIVWGFVGPTHARFVDFVFAPTPVARYALDLIRHRERHYLGHNPLGGYMVLALLAAIAATCISGWLYTTDRFWGVEWVGELHEGTANSVLLLVAMHVAGVLFASVREGENLVAAMFHGRKRAR